MSNWQIHTIDFGNIFSYGGINSLALLSDTKYLISGSNLDDAGADSNGSGKSAFCDAFSWCLFGKTPRTEHFSEIIRSGTEEAYAKIYLVNGDEGIEIERRQNSKGKTLKFVVNGDDSTTLRTATLTQKAINRYLGFDESRGYSDYLSQVYFSTESSKGFLSADVDPAERQAVLERFLGLSVFDVARDLAKEDRKKATKDLEFVEFAIKGLHEQILVLGTHGKLVMALKANKNAVDNCEIRLDRLTKVKSTVSNLQTLLMTANATLTASKTALNLAQCDLPVKESKYSLAVEVNAANISLKEEWLALKPEYERQLENLKRQQEKYSKIAVQVVELESELEKIISERRIGIRKRDEIDAQILKAQECPECSTTLMVVGNRIQSFDKSSLQAELEVLAEGIFVLDDKVVMRTARLKNMKIGQTSFNGHLKMLAEQNLILHNKKLAVEEMDFSVLDERKTAFDLVTLQVKTCTDQYEKEEEVYDIAENNITLSLVSVQKTNPSLIVPSDRNLAGKLSHILEQAEKDFITITECQAGAKADIKVGEENLKRHNKLSEEWKEYQTEGKKYFALQTTSRYWENSFPDIKRQVLKKFVPLFESTVNRYLSDLEISERVEFSLEAESKKGNIRPGFSISVFDGEVWRPFKVYSGGEKSRILVAVGFSLVELAGQRTTVGLGFLFCDELLDNIDYTGMRYFFKLLDKVPGQKFVITHAKSDLAISETDSILQVTKIDGVSSVQCVTKI